MLRRAPARISRWKVSPNVVHSAGRMLGCGCGHQPRWSRIAGQRLGHRCDLQRHAKVPELPARTVAREFRPACSGPHGCAKNQTAIVVSRCLDAAQILHSRGMAAGVYHHTAPVNMTYALHEALGIVLEEGLGKPYRASRANAPPLARGLGSDGHQYIPKAFAAYPELRPHSRPGRTMPARRRRCWKNTGSRSVPGSA